MKTYKLMKTYKITIKIEIVLSENDINNILTTAFEGGINYWCSHTYPIMDKNGKWWEGVPEDELANPMLDYNSGVIALGGKLKLYDSETGEIYILTLPKVLKGIQMYAESRGIYNTDDLACVDAGDADCIVQYALFDNLIFS